ncbi:TolC family protein [Janthinobacterium sp. 17J80-10]|uniref:TolC family protein n=1 Tax=Janthinobacterium sp. 17J80-10 TaxID=2497863 RepID=UPI0010057ECD|nr:TolC family protein [Janthinobacterium sp. 17J80-10]QAU33324.1 TolC family protein [Janthinobacterium sp. 17J80-10]
MDFQKYKPILRPVVLGAAALVLAGCATISDDGGMNAVTALTRERTGQAVQLTKPGGNTESVDKSVNQLLGKPLTPDTAVQVALLNNQGLQASFAELGIAEADRISAGWMRNPSFSFGRMRTGSDVEIDRSIMFDLVGLLTIPIRSGIEQRRFEQARLQTAAQAVQLAADTRKAYFHAVAAQQTAQYMEQVGSAAEAAAELARRMAQVGNFSKLDQAREQAFHADATAQVARARHNATAARERLSRLMGVWGDKTAFQLPERLPALPKAPDTINDAESQAMQQRLDIQMAKRGAESTAKALGLTKASRFINVLDVGYANKSETGAPRGNGYEIELQLPIFDWSGAKVAKAEAIYMQSVYRTADIAIRARSEVREAYSAYRTTYDVARHYRDEVVPLRKKISDEVLLRYNGMLASVFELLADARTQIGSVNAAIEAQRDYWLAETDLQAAINGSGGGSATTMRTPASAEAAPGH